MEKDGYWIVNLQSLFCSMPTFEKKIELKIFLKPDIYQKCMALNEFDWYSGCQDAQDIEGLFKDNEKSR